MRTKNHIQVIIVTCMVLSLVLFSCNSAKKAAVSCPEFPVSKYQKVGHVHKKKQHKIMLANNGLNNQVSRSGHSVRFLKNRNRKQVAESASTVIQLNYLSDDLNQDSSQSRAEYLESLTASSDNKIIPLVKVTNSTLYQEKSNSARQETAGMLLQQTGCDTVVLRIGDNITGKVIEIGQDEIKYKKCDNLSGPIYSIRSSEVFVIIYANGTREFFTPMSQPYSSGPIAVKKVEGLGLAGFICSLGGLVIAGIPLGILAIVFGATSLNKISKYPDKFMGKGFAITGIILGLVDIIGVIILLSSM